MFETSASERVSQSFQSIIALTNSHFTHSPPPHHSTSGIEFANYPTKEILFGLTALESYLDLNAQDLEFGFNETRRDRILRTFVRNVFHFHLNEIYSMLKVGRQTPNQPDPLLAFYVPPSFQGGGAAGKVVQR